MRLLNPTAAAKNAEASCAAYKLALYGKTSSNQTELCKRGVAKTENGNQTAENIHWTQTALYRNSYSTKKKQRTQEQPVKKELQNE